MVAFTDFDVQRLTVKHPVHSVPVCQKQISMLSTSYTNTLLLGGLNLGVDTALDRGTLGADSAVNLKHFVPKSQSLYKVQVQNLLSIFILKLDSYCTLPGLGLSICFPVGLEPAFVLLLTQVSFSKLHF